MNIMKPFHRCYPHERCDPHAGRQYSSTVTLFRSKRERQCASHHIAYSTPVRRTRDGGQCVPRGRGLDALGPNRPSCLDREAHYWCDSSFAQRTFGLNYTDVYCLFGTVHVKTASAILTVMYMALVVAFLQYEVLHTNAAIFYYVLCAATLVSTLLAQYGLYKDGASLLMPLMILQSVVIVVLVAYFVFGVVMLFVMGDGSSLGRNIMILITVCIVLWFNLFCLSAFRGCWEYFTALGKALIFSRMMVCDDVLEDVVLFDKFAK
uniref:Chitin synthase export chaperone n=1 Tax=Parascaris univalens TaxID=6257 RepID=A0A914ZTM3_PARUN